MKKVLLVILMLCVVFSVAFATDDVAVATGATTEKVGFFAWVKGIFTDTIDVVCEIILAVILLASLIVKLTPSTKDNEILGKIMNFLDRFSIAKTAFDKELIEKARENIEKK